MQDVVSSHHSDIIISSGRQEKLKYGKVYPYYCGFL